MCAALCLFSLTTSLLPFPLAAIVTQCVFLVCKLTTLFVLNTNKYSNIQNCLWHTV